MWASKDEVMRPRLFTEGDGRTVEFLMMKIVLSVAKVALVPVGSFATVEFKEVEWEP